MKSLKKSIGSKKAAAVTAAKKTFAGDCSQRIKRPRKNGKAKIF
jgi:hypothetical protein